MGKDLHNDDFEDFFRKYLEGFDGQPSDKMWDRIEPVIPPKPGVTWSAYAWPSAFILSLILLVFVGYKMFEYKKTLENLTEQLEQSNRNISSLKGGEVRQNTENIQPDFYSNHSSSNNLSPNKDRNKRDFERMQKEDAAIIFKNKKERKSKNRPLHFVDITPHYSTEKTEKTVNDVQNIGQQQTSIVKETIPIIQEIREEIQQNSGKIAPKTNQPTAAVMNWNELAIKSFFVFYQKDLELNKAVRIEEALLDKVLTNKNSFALFVAPTILKNNILPLRPQSAGNPPPPMPNIPRPIPIERASWGRAIGVKYGHSLTDKLSLNIGGIYTNASYRFNTRHFLRYDKRTEEDISINKAGNTIDYSGSSTYGEYSVGADVTRLKDNGTTQDENIGVKVDATAEIHSVIVPVCLTYELFKINDFSVGIKAGVSYNNVIANDLKVNSFEIEEQGFEVDDFRLKKRPRPSKNGAINSMSGLVLAYEFKDNWSLMVEPTRTSAVSDNHKSDFGRTKSNLFNMEIGLKYRF